MKRSIEKAQHLAHINKELFTVEKTPIALLMGPTQYMSVHPNTTKERISEDLDIVSSENEETIKGLANDLAPIIDKTIRSYREEVLPVITQYTSNLQVALDAVPEEDPTEGYEVLFASAPDVLTAHPEIFNTEKYSGRRVRDHVIPTALCPYMVESELALTLSTGNQEVDSSIQSWLTDADTRKIMEVYDMVFTGPTNLRIVDEMYQKSTAIEMLDASTMLYLLATKYRESPTADVVNIDLASYTTTMDKIIEFAGIKIIQGIRNYQAAIRSKLFIIRRGNLSITVLKSSYEEYRNEGGSIESLLGNLITDRSKNDLTSAIENIFNDTKQWNTTVKLKEAASKRKRLSFLQTLAANTINKDYQATELEILRNNNKEIKLSDVMDRAKEVVKSLDATDFTSIHTLALKVICRTRFWFTDAEDFFTTMQTARNENPDITTEEAKLLASIEYVAKYLSAQIGVKRIY